MSKGFTGSICIEQQFEGSILTGKDGKKYVCIDNLTQSPFNVGKSNGLHYMNIVVWNNDTTDERGNDGSIQASLTKEQREGGMKPKYIGNIKAMGGGSTPAPVSQTAVHSAGAIDDLPF